MEYSRIVAVTGLPGLFEIITSKSDGAIVRSLDDESTKFVSSRVHNLSHLESIEIYTTGENVSLADVFTALKSSTEAQPDVKDPKALKSYFAKVFPQLDTERVYASDMKKMVNWFTSLQKHNIDYTAKEEPQEEVAAAEVKAEAPPAVKPAKKAKATDTDAPPVKAKAKAKAAPDAVAEVEPPKATKTRKKKTEK